MGNCCPGSSEYERLVSEETNRRQYGGADRDVLNGSQRNSHGSGDGTAQKFWDIRNCRVPRGIHPAVVVEKLRGSRTSRGYAPSRIVATVAMEQLHLTTREALVASGVDILDCSSSKPSASDFLLLEEIQKWTFYNPTARSGVILITRDRDFARRLSFLRDVGYDILLVHAPLVSDTMKAVVANRLSWNDVCGVPVRVPAPPKPPAPPFTTTRLPPIGLSGTERASQQGHPRGSGGRVGSVWRCVAIADPDLPVVFSHGPSKDVCSSDTPTSIGNPVERTEDAFDYAVTSESHYDLLAKLDRPKRSLDFWSVYGVLYWIDRACFHLPAGRDVPLQHSGASTTWRTVDSFVPHLLSRRTLLVRQHISS